MAAKSKPVAVVVGAGPGIGAAVARKFAAKGYAVALLARHEGKVVAIKEQIVANSGTALPISCDAADEKSVEAAFEKIREKLGHPEVLVYNAAIRLLHEEHVKDVPNKRFLDFWKTNCYGAFLTSKQVIPEMIKNKKGTIILTGATSSWRSLGGYSSFAVGKFGLRALGQSLARELGPQGIHVAHVVVDAAVDTEFVRPFVAKRFKDGKIPEGVLLEPQDLAEQYWALHTQPKSVWTQELDVRPFGEPIANKL